MTPPFPPSGVNDLTSEAKRELLAELLATRRTVEPMSACSYNQRSLWFMHQLAPESTAYNVSVTWRIRPALDVDALHRAFQRLVARHEVLRTTYESKDGEPWQRVRASVPDGFSTRAVPDCDEAALLAEVQGEGRKPFDLSNGPVLRATVFSRSRSDHVLLISIHHIACDLWSVEHMIDELRELYGQEIGALAASTTLARAGTYRDFTAWQRRLVDGPEGATHWDYWREKLNGRLPRLELPADRARPAIESFARDTVQFSIAEDLIETLRACAAAEHTTLFTLFVAAFECLLARYSGQDDILLGSVSSGRSRHEFESTIGYFVNSIIFRGDFSDDPTFRELLQRTKADVLAVLEHQDFPFPLLVERLRLPRDPSRAPICDADIIWDKSRDPGEWLSTERADGHAFVRMDWFGTTVETYPINQVGAPSDLGLVVFEVGPTISINLGYSTDLFDRSTAESFGRHFIELLRGVCFDADVRVSQLAFTTAEERARLAVVPDKSSTFSRNDRPLHLQFEAIAKTQPDAIAVSGTQDRLTYGELNERADALARRLRALGVGRGTIVGLRLDRGVHIAVGILGILKAGGAYLPIDIAYPESRADFMLRDSGARALVTQSTLDTAVAIDMPRVFLERAAVDDAIGEIFPSSVAGSEPASQLDDLAYVIYTSGSTGQPKGVLVSHRNVARLFDATRQWFAFDERDVWSLFHSIAFDFSVWEFWGALLHGARLVVVPYTVSRSPEDFLALLAEERVTILNQTPSAFRQLIAADASRQSLLDLALRVVIFGGEALDVNMLRSWFDRRGDQIPQLVNMYGITETTVHSTYRPIKIADLGRRVRSPIGVAIPDLQLHVLDPAGQPVPIGVPGELYVGGAGVARGYLNRPELTQQRFLVDATSTGPDARLYRSGDLVRRLADGDIEYLGRIDLQVKVRGFRIELGEIETALASHPAVDHCAVVVRPDANGESRIIAYVVPRAGEEPSSAELQAFVKRGLPDYMMPSAFVRLAALPLTNSSKLDVNALPAPDLIESTSTRTFVAPTTREESELADEWQRLLGVARVGVDDDFFELGGHSILATGLARWIRSHFQIDFPVYAVFESPTVAGMARRVADLRDAGQPMTAAAEAREEFDL